MYIRLVTCEKLCTLRLYICAMSIATSFFQEHLSKSAVLPRKSQAIIIVDCRPYMTNPYEEWKKVFDGLINYSVGSRVDYHLYTFHLMYKDGYSWVCFHNGQQDFDIQEQVKDYGTVGMMDYIREEIIRGNLHTGENARRPIVAVDYHDLGDTEDCVVRKCLARWDEHRRPSRCYRLACMDDSPESIQDFNNVSTFGDVVPGLTGLPSSTKYGCGVGICQAGNADTPLAHTTMEYGADRLPRSIHVILNATAAGIGSFFSDDEPDIM